MAFLNNGVTGHRGDPQHFPENTVESFAAAIELGCDWVETDLRLTRDGRVVLSHDNHTGRVAEKYLILAEHDAAELRRLNMAAFFNQIHFDRVPVTARLPFLEEALELFRGQNKTRLSLQPKEPETLPIVAKLCREMHIPQELIGFNDGVPDTVVSARKLFPEAYIFYDVRPRDLDAELALAEQCDFAEVVVWEYGLTPEIVARIRERGFVPGVWSPASPAEMDRWLAMDVQRFYTDFPAVLLEKLRARQ